MPKDSKKFSHRGADLIIALYTQIQNPPVQPSSVSANLPSCVKVLPLKSPQYKLISIKDALLLAKERIYEGVVWNGRVYKMREVDCALTPDPAYWDDRACIKYHNDDSTMIPRKIKDANQAALWDQMLRQGRFAI